MIQRQETLHANTWVSEETLMERFMLVDVHMKTCYKEGVLDTKYRILFFTEDKKTLHGEKERGC